ncbi:NADPH:quinone oxidoreductase family protein [Streptomyces sp. NPDC052079]|uniref:NADPH:quinone oxidoreductase family protein n=1 Tax=Streptomyces sp. NPDC052079 TaxID=3155526 RepID=UPI00341F823B
MRAVMVDELGPSYSAALQETPDPVPAAGEVLVRIEAAPVNYVDLVTLTGAYQFKPKLPYTPGKGPAGVVEALGEGVTHLAVGDRVLAMAEYGGYAELVTADHRQVYRLPDAMPFADAAAISLAFDTAWMALRERARIQPGESVLVLGAGGAVGGAAVQLAKAMGAGLVLAGTSSPDGSAAARAAGADGVVDLSRPDLRESVREQVLAATDGAGVDIVIDPLGGDPFDGAIRSIAWRGRLVVVGFAAGRIPTLKVNYTLLKNIEVSGLQISDYRRRRPDLMAECYRELFAFYTAGAVKAPPSTALPLSQWRRALTMIAQRAAPGRLVLEPRE